MNIKQGFYENEDTVFNNILSKSTPF